MDTRLTDRIENVELTSCRVAFWVLAPSLEEHECKQTDGENEQEETEKEKEMEKTNKKKKRWKKEKKMKEGPTVTNSN